MASIQPAGGVPQLITKGDNNETEDGAPVPADEVIGVARAWVPVGGHVVTFLQTAQGRIAFFAILLALFALRWFWDDLFERPAGPILRRSEVPTERFGDGLA